MLCDGYIIRITLTHPCQMVRKKTAASLWSNSSVHLVYCVLYIFPIVPRTHPSTHWNLNANKAKRDIQETGEIQYCHVGDDHKLLIFFFCSVTWIYFHTITTVKLFWITYKNMICDAWNTPSERSQVTHYHHHHHRHQSSVRWWRRFSSATLFNSDLSSS